MSTSFKSARVLDSWDETVTSEIADGPKTARAAVKYTLSGILEGTSKLDYSMAYLADGTAFFLGYEQISVSVDGEASSLVLRHEGKYDSAGASFAVAVLDGSGTGRLASGGHQVQIIADPSDHRNSTLEITLSSP
jgi:hypothetical protein